MNWINILLSSLGSMASILGIIFTLKKEEKKRNLILYAIILLLTVSTSILSYKYSESNREKLQVKERKETIKVEANRLLKKAPTYISSIESGENEGIIYGLLVLLENNKDIFPETYESYKRTVIERIQKADTLDIYKKEDIMQESGKSAIQFLKSLSN